VVCAPAAEEVNEGLAIERNWELLPEAQFELINLQEAVLVIVDVLNGSPHFRSFVQLACHVGS